MQNSVNQGIIVTLRKGFLDFCVKFSAVIFVLFCVPIIAIDRWNRGANLLCARF